MYRYDSKEFPYPLNESMQEFYELLDSNDQSQLLSAFNNLYYDLKDLYTFKKVPLQKVQEMQNYFRGLLYN